MTQFAKVHEITRAVGRLELAGVPPEAVACAGAYLQGRSDSEATITESSDEAIEALLQMAQRHDGPGNISDIGRAVPGRATQCQGATQWQVATQSPGPGCL